jgi:hypothetical protein
MTDISLLVVTLRRGVFPVKSPDGSPLEPELQVNGFIHHRVHYRRAYHGGGS